MFLERTAAIMHARRYVMLFSAENEYRNELYFEHIDLFTYGCVYDFVYNVLPLHAHEIVFGKK